jgi:pimeloyl-ACP methyl ester carboxylesterase
MAEVANQNRCSFPIKRIGLALLLTCLTCTPTPTTQPSTRQFSVTVTVASTPASAPAAAETQPAVTTTQAAPPAIRVTSVAPLHDQRFPENLIRVEYTSPTDNASDWALVLPPLAGRTWIICIHGHGSTGDQLYTRPDIRREWLPIFKHEGFGILTPNLRGNAWMSPAAAADLHELLQYIRRQYAAERFIFVGGSMGGTSNLIYAALHPEDVAAVVALCPAADLSSYYRWCRQRPAPAVLQQIADAIADAYGCEPETCESLYRTHSATANPGRLTMPVYVVHGAQDNIIPVTQSRNLYRAIQFKGIFHYREIPEGDHETPLRSMADGLQWVLKRLRQPSRE